MKKQFLIIGLGRFGVSVARTLANSGHDVIGIDNKEARIQRVAAEINDAIKCDAKMQKSWSRSASMILMRQLLQ